MKQVITGIIKLYQKFLSRDTGWLARFYPKRTCRFYPTCSQYTIEAIEEYGVVRGIWLGSGRILRCHPWNKGGMDRVPKRNKLKFRKNNGENNINLSKDN